MSSRGVLVGCDQKQEWMLPWWVENFRLHSRLPIAFVDFGMTEHAKKWCKAHGSLITLKAPQGFVYPKSQIAQALSAAWEEKYGIHLWSYRSVCFNKPFALLQTPFKETIWIDLDCEILGPIDHLFTKIHRHSRFALVRDTQDETGYNSGMIVYEASSPLLIHWAAACIRKNNQFLGDQDVLSHLIQEGHIEVTELPEKYNWVVRSGIHPEAVVLHWSGSWGKQIIRNKTIQHLYGSGLA